MRTASISEAKATFSECIKFVTKTGDDMLVTERGRIVAKISPFRRSDTPDDMRMEQLELAGLVKVGTGHIPESFWESPAPKGRARLAIDALIEEREEGL